MIFQAVSWLLSSPLNLPGGIVFVGVGSSVMVLLPHQLQ